MIFIFVSKNYGENDFFFFFLRKCLPTSLEVQGNNNIPKYTKHNRIYILLLNYLVKLETPSISQGQINQECYLKQWQVFLLLLFAKFKKWQVSPKNNQGTQDKNRDFIASNILNYHKVDKREGKEKVSVEKFTSEPEGKF